MHDCETFMHETFRAIGREKGMYTRIARVIFDPTVHTLFCMDLSPYKHMYYQDL